jgi:hypothetical protein
LLAADRDEAFAPGPLRGGMAAGADGRREP